MVTSSNMLSFVGKHCGELVRLQRGNEGVGYHDAAVPLWERVGGWVRIPSQQNWVPVDNRVLRTVSDIACVGSAHAPTT